MNRLMEKFLLVYLVGIVEEVDCSVYFGITKGRKPKKKNGLQTKEQQKRQGELPPEGWVTT